MLRTNLEEAWACWLPGSAGGPRLNMPSFSVFSVSLTVVTTWDLCGGGPVAHTDSAGSCSGIDG